MRLVAKPDLIPVSLPNLQHSDDQSQMIRMSYRKPCDDVVAPRSLPKAAQDMLQEHGSRLRVLEARKRQKGEQAVC